VGVIHSPSGIWAEEIVSVRSTSIVSSSWLSGRDPYSYSLPSDYEEASGLIFVVGSNDIQRIRDAREMLYDPSMLAHPLLAGKPLLVLANKLDLPLATSPATVAAELKLHNLTNEWHVQGCSAYNGDGLDEGLKWLATTMKRHI
jgi:signal recognition particle receptor subunit beta